LPLSHGLGLIASSTHRVSSLRRDAKIEKFHTKKSIFKGKRTCEGKTYHKISLDYPFKNELRGTYLLLAEKLPADITVVDEDDMEFGLDAVVVVIVVVDDVTVVVEEDMYRVVADVDGCF
jgi:hypothetical protein